MTRGRTRDDLARRRILDATAALLGSQGAGQVRIDDIAGAAQVGRQTIYRWWPTKTAVVIDALLDSSTRETPFGTSGDARADLRKHLLGVVRLFNSTTGNLIRELLAEAQSDPSVGDEFRARFWQPRRDRSAEFLAAAIARGQIRPDVHVEDTLDVIYSPLWARLVIGHRKLDTRLVDHILDVVFTGVSATAADR